MEGYFGLRRWNHVTRRIETLIAFDQLPAFAPLTVSDNGTELALVNNGQIVVLDLGTLLKTNLNKAPSYLPQVAISPDGESVAYIDPSIFRQSRSGAPVTAGEIYAIEVDAPAQRLDLGLCGEENGYPTTGDCRGFLWSPDGRQLAWRDARGIWLADLKHPATPKLFKLPDYTNYSVWAWSPSGRYLLLEQESQEGNFAAVLDTQTGRLKGFHFIGPREDITWLQDDRLFTIWPMEIWRLDPASDGLLKVEARLNMRIVSGSRPRAVTQFEDGQLAFGLLNNSYGDYQSRGLYGVEASTLQPHRLTGLPPYVPIRGGIHETTLVWNPDGTGVIFQNGAPDFYQPDNQLFYIPTDGSAIYDLRPIVEDALCCFTWVR